MQLRRIDKGIASGNPCEAIMWFEAGVAAINKCDARIVQLLGASHEVHLAQHTSYVTNSAVSS